MHCDAIAARSDFMMLFKPEHQEEKSGGLCKQIWFKYPKQKFFYFLHITEGFKGIAEGYLLTEIPNLIERAHQSNFFFFFSSSFYNTLQSI